MAESFPRFWGPFVLVESLGEGGMARVFRATPREGGRPVALKVLHSQRALNTRQLERFKREGEITAKLRHPGIVSVHASGEHEGLPYLVYELVYPAETLALVLPRLSLVEQVSALRDVARALGYAHSQGVVHRDLKPDNVLVSDGRCLVADFGLARIDGAERLTRTGAVTGTPLYMAPEQMIGDRKAVGPCSDVWALGVILYETLCKSHPFPGLSYVELIELTKSAPTPPSSVNPGVPRELSNACMRALNPKPKKRYANAAEFAGALDQWLAQTEEPPVGVGALVAGAALLVLGGLAVGLLPRFVDAPTPPPPAKTSPVDGQPVDPEPTATLPIEPLAIDLVARRTGIQRGLEQLESDDLRGLQRTLEQLELPPDLPGMSDHGAELANLLLVHLRDRALGGGEWDDSSELLLRSLAKAGLRPTDRRAGDALLDHLWAEWHALKRVETETFESALICLVRLDIDPQEEHLLTLSRLDTEAYRKNRDPLIRALSRLREFFGANPGSEQRLAMAELLDAQNTKFGPRFRSRCWAAARGGKGSAEVRLSRLRRARELAPRSPWPRIPLARALLQLGRPQEAALEAVQAFVLFEGGGYPDRIIVVGGSGFRMKAKGVEVLLEAGALREAKASLATIKTRNSRERKKLEALRTRVSEGSR